MHDRATHWAIILFSGMLFGLTVWLLGFTSPVPPDITTAANDLSYPRQGVQGAPSRSPAARRPTLPSAGQEPLVIGDQPARGRVAPHLDQQLNPSASRSANAKRVASSKAGATGGKNNSSVQGNKRPKATGRGQSSAPQPALIAPGVGERFSPGPVLSPNEIELPAEGAESKVQSRIAEAVAQRADLEIRRGMELAQRRAFFSGRAAIVDALRLIAEAQDAAVSGVKHSQALAAGLRALEESDDFIATNGELEGDMDARGIAAGHRTPILREQNQGEVAPLAARRDYYTYAQQQLAQAVEGEPVGSMALFALGKMHTVLAEQKAVIVPGAESKALVFHQAAMLVSPNNPLASNELGVLLARGGRLEEARTWLVHSAQISALPATWHNLSVVHHQLGENSLAQAAGEESRLANRGQPLLRSGENRPDVKWVDAKVFAEQNPNLDDNSPAPASAAQAPGNATPNKARQSSAPVQRSRK